MPSTGPLPVTYCHDKDHKTRNKEEAAQGYRGSALIASVAFKRGPREPGRHGSAAALQYGAAERRAALEMQQPRVVRVGEGGSLARGSGAVIVITSLIVADAAVVALHCALAADNGT